MSAEPETGSRRRTRPTVVALFVATQVLVLGILVELGSRLFDPLGVSYFPETARLLDQMIIEEPIGYRLPPGLEGRFHGAEVSVNELGMRDRPVPREKAAGEKRILMMGDSVMFSIGVEVEDSIPRQLEKIANERAPDGTHYRTLNMGVPSYNTEQQRVQLEQVGLSLDPDMAVMLVVANDLESKMWVFEKRASFAADFAQRSYGISLVFTAGRPWVRRTLNHFLPELEQAPLIGKVGWVDLDQSQLYSRIEEPLSKIQLALERAGIPLLLMIYRNVDPGLVARLESMGKEAGFAVRMLDVWSDPRWRAETRADHINSYSDTHCNPRGCYLHAMVIYDSLVESHILTPR